MGNSSDMPFLLLRYEKLHRRPCHEESLRNLVKRSIDGCQPDHGFVEIRQNLGLQPKLRVFSCHSTQVGKLRTQNLRHGVPHGRLWWLNQRQLFRLSRPIKQHLDNQEEEEEKTSQQKKKNCQTNPRLIVILMIKYIKICIPNITQSSKSSS